MSNAHSAFSPQAKIQSDNMERMDTAMAQSIIDALFHYMLVFDKHSIGLPIARLKNCLLNVEQNDIGNLFSYLEKLLQSADRINVNI